ncbi:Polysaccharide biosynthesis protein [Bifidobacterium margollesii]|uniref:Polysaccharide biosynthesis protein n=1 Tax=Bifidobacterium margollesii TaxID=2020964 RepID=A0A2N5J8Y0_9BIFI|nr:hypothetical protein [Bifidobacterium margollesii]PLS30667.1 Polysaccharide biosynthesis protein [Bifidobacterium margollesii]
MDYKKILQNFGVAVLAQGTSVLASCATTLLVPKVLGVAAFGYWQLFIFYTTYAGIFHLGLNDGVYLLIGGQRRNQVNKDSVKSQFVVGAVAQGIFAVVIGILAFISQPDPNRRFVIIVFALWMFINNIAWYLGFVFQAINETKLFSIATLIDRFLFLVALIFLLLAKEHLFQVYVIGYLITRIISLFYTLWKGRDFLAAKCFGVRESIVETINSVRIGIKVMIAGVASLAILGVARVVIDHTWGIEVFGKISFALSMCNFFLSFITQVSMVLFPALRQGTRQERIHFYERARNCMDIVLPALYLAYFPLVIILALWLPQYQSSLSAFALVLPICVFDSKMNVLGTTYLKVLRKEKILLAVNVAAVALSVCLVLLALIVFHSPNAVIGAGAVTLIVRYLVTQHILASDLNVKTPVLGQISELMFTAVFVFAALMLDTLPAFAVVLVAYGLYCVFNRHIISDVVKALKKIR